MMTDLLPQTLSTELEWARTFLQKYPRKLEERDTFCMELLLTYMFGIFLRDNGKEIIGIGFPVKDTKRKIDLMSYDEVVENLRQESDFDSFLAIGQGDELTALTIQIVRYIPKTSDDTDTLFTHLLEKKLKKYHKDAALHLLVWIESQFRFEPSKLHQLLFSHPIPFGSIVIIGHVGSETDLTFLCSKVYPELEGPYKFDMRRFHKKNDVET